MLKGSLNEEVCISFILSPSAEVADIEEVNICDSGELLFDVDFDNLVRSEIVPQEMKDELPKPE